MKGKWFFCFISGMVFLVFLSNSVFGHDSFGSSSFSIILTQKNIVNYNLNVPNSELSKIINRFADSELSEYIETGISIKNSGVDCPLKQLKRHSVPETRNIILDLYFACSSSPIQLEVEFNLFYDFDEKHIHFARVGSIDGPGRFYQLHTLTKANSSFFYTPLPGQESLAGSRSWLEQLASKTVILSHRFFVLGFKHVLSGYDHILFIISITLLAGTLWSTVKFVTAFTVAHTFTLGLAFFEIAIFSPRLVESAIALSIAYVAAINLSRIPIGKPPEGTRTKYKHRLFITFLFGLIHGLGFSGYLRQVTISPDEMITALISFNIGIETGQVLIVGMLFPALVVLGRYRWKGALIRVVSVGIFCIGIVWFFQRAIGGNGLLSFY